MSKIHNITSVKAPTTKLRKALVFGGVALGVVAAGIVLLSVTQNPEEVLEADVVE